jgi:hypothetical protein
MAWQTFETQGSGFRYDGIRVMKSYILITKFATEKLQGTERVFIKMDKGSNAIMLSPTKETTGYKISTKQKKVNSYAIVCPIYREMPMGRYYFQEQTDEGFIYKLKSPL